MSKKLVVDNNNFPIGFYDTLVTKNVNIPANAFDITDSQWQEFIDNGKSRKWNISTSSVDIYEDSTILVDYKESQKQKIDIISEKQREKYITIAAGQALTYQEKSDEATDYITAGSPIDLTPYPFIQAEVNATGKSATVASNDILAAQSSWISKGSLIEEHRIKTKIDIEAAATILDIDNIVVVAISNIELI